MIYFDSGPCLLDLARNFNFYCSNKNHLDIPQTLPQPAHSNYHNKMVITETKLLLPQQQRNNDEHLEITAQTSTSIVSSRGLIFVEPHLVRVDPLSKCLLFVVPWLSTHSWRISSVS